MAKKQSQENEVVKRRQTRKEQLRARKTSQQTRQVRLGVFIVAGLIAAIMLIAAINELLIQPGRAVAEVGDEVITLREWQERVRYERAQRIILLENQLEAFGGDVGIIQQFSSQAIVQLLDEEAFGQGVLDAMIDEHLIRQAAEARGITVTDDEIDEEIGTIYNFYDGELPTPLPTATETIMPTPSLTPIPTQVITEVLPTNTPFPTPTVGPTNTPLPTATAVSVESFNEQFGEFVDRLDGLGADEDLFRTSIENALYREKLAEAIAEEEELSNTAPHVSFYRLTYNSEEEANEALAMIEAEGYVTVWNTVRSLLFDTSSTSTADASEIVWSTQETVENRMGGVIADTAFELPLETPSELIIEEGDAGRTYSILYVTGREERELTESQFAQLQQDRLASFLSNQLDVERFSSVYLGRAPRQPVLDPLFLEPPTPTPPIVVPSGDDGN